MNDPHFPISDRVDGASAAETLNWGSIPDRVKPKTIKIGICSFLTAGRLALKKNGVNCEASIVSGDR